MTKLNGTNQNQLIAQKNKVICITILVSNIEVKDKIKRVVPKKLKSGTNKG